MSGYLVNTLKGSATNIVDSELLNYWNTVLPTIEKKSSIIEREITEVMAYKYISDLFGLFRYEFNIPDEYLYPNIRINGYLSSHEYNGVNTSFKIISPSTLNMYYNLYITQRKRKERKNNARNK